MAFKVSASGPIAGGSTPRKFGWSSGKPIRPPPGAGVAHTGSFWRSTSATQASQPPLASMSGPATSTGLRASSSRAGEGLEGDGVGQRAAGRRGARSRAGRVLSASASQSSIGIETNAGPRGGSEAWWIARAMRRGTSSARGGSWAHFTYGCGPSTASRLVRFASIVICGRTCWPAVISSGDLFACALKIPPTALPTPGAVWRLTCVAGRSPARSRRPSRRRPAPGARGRSGSPPGSRRASAARSSPGCRRSSSSRARGTGRTSLRGPSSRERTLTESGRAAVARRRSQGVAVKAAAPCSWTGGDRRRGADAELALERSLGGEAGGQRGGAAAHLPWG